MSTIFISHSERDLRTVNEIVKELEQAGYRTWYRERDLLPVTSQSVQIESAINGCQAVALVVSFDSVLSDQANHEMTRAFETRRPLVAILLDITPVQLQARKPEWRRAPINTTMVCIPTDGFAVCISRIVEGLKSNGVLPGLGTSGSAALRRLGSKPANHTPKHLTRKILAAKSAIEGERKQVTVLFADVSGFTSMSEKLDPEEVHGLVSECMVFLAEEVHRYEGTIAQFLGDGIMALFGAPIAHEDAPQRALHAALGIRERAREHAAKLRLRGIEMDMRIGLNTGLVIVGRIGDDLTMEYTAIGDTVNVASRMESAAAAGTIWVAESTYRLTQGYFEFKPLGQVDLKGKQNSVNAYELLHATIVKSRLAASSTRGLTPFVGRRKEIEHLMECYEKSKQGHGQVVGIVGDPGIGKSRLLLQMRETLPKDELSYLEGGCFHYGDAVPYLPLLRALRSYFDLEEGEDQSSAKRKMKERIERLDQRLETCLPPLQEMLSLKVADEQYAKLDPPQKRGRTFEALRNLLIRESQKQPLVVAVEDLHWIDHTSEEFLSYFINSIALSRVLMVVLYRPEYTNKWTSRTYYSQIRLDELPSESSAEMVQAILSEGRSAHDLNQFILSRAAGNPLFVEEITKALLDHGCIRRMNGNYVLDAKSSDIQLPETIQGIIGARIDRLEDDLRRTLQVASVVGRGFSLRILEAVTGASEGLKSCLTDLASADFIYETVAPPEMEYSFRHSLIQEVAYNTLLFRNRKRLHQMTGEAIEQLYRSRLEEFCEVLAYHYCAADDPDKAFRYLRLSAEKAHHSYSTSEAFRYYREALDVLGRQSDTEQNRRTRVETTLLMYVVMVALNFPEGSRGILEEARRAANELSDRRAWVRLSASIGLLLSMRGDFLEGVKITQEAFEEAERLGDEATVLWTAQRLCNNYLHWGEAVKGADVAYRAIALLERAGVESRGPVPEFDQYVTLLYYLGWARGVLGDFDEGERLCDKAIRSASEGKNKFSMAGAHVFRAIVSLYRGRPERILYYGREAARLSEEIQMPYVLGPSWMVISWGLYYQGDWGAAREWAEKAISLLLEHRMWPPVSPAHLVSGLASRELGELHAARRSIEEAVKVARDNRQRSYEAQATIELGRLLPVMDSSQTAAAERLILEGMKVADDLKIKPVQALGHFCLGETYIIAGAKDRAMSSLKKARQMCQEMGMDYYLARTEMALAKLKA